MADGIVTQPQEANNGISPELKRQMDYSVYGKTDPVQPNPDNNNPNPPAGTTDAPAPPPFTFDSLKEKFGYETPDAVYKEIEELRLIREKGMQPPPPPEIKYENDDSKRIAEALQGGKMQDVYQYLHRQQQLDEILGKAVDKTTAEGVIKLGMSLKYKDLSPEEIDYKYRQQFAIPKKPEQRVEETDEEFAARTSEWQTKVNDIEMNQIIEAKLLRPELEASKSKLVIPSVTNPLLQEFEDWKKGIEEDSKLNEQTIAQYKTFTPDAIEIKMPYTDESGKINFEFLHKPDQESFNEAVSMVSDISLLFKKFQNQDGTPDRMKFLKAIYFGLNQDKIIGEALKQSKNGTLKSQLPNNSSSNGRMNMPQATDGGSELDNQMKKALAGYM